jgi:hypothetical protein
LADTNGRREMKDDICIAHDPAQMGDIAHIAANELYVTR